MAHKKWAMSTYHHPVFGFRLKPRNSKVINALYQIYNAEKYPRPVVRTIAPFIYCGSNSDPDLLFGFRPQQCSIEPVFQATAIEEFTSADPRSNPELKTLIASVEPQFLAWLKTGAPAWTNKRELWEGPTLWLCPHT